MNKFLIPLAAAAFGLSSGLALADEASGQIAQMDESAGVIVLDSGQAFRLSDNASMDGLQAGIEVTVSFEINPDTGEAVATQVAPR